MNSKDVGYFDPEQPVEETAGNLPHWRQDGVTYFVTFRLADSIPAETFNRWQRERTDWLARHTLPYTPAQRKEYYEQFVVRFQNWLDAGHGKCVLAAPEIRQIVSTALLFFVNQRYLLREWVVMPNHVHVVVTPLAGHELSNILHSWKSFSAKEINKRLGTTGELWQRESFDHIVRSPEHLIRIEQYIHDNPLGLNPESYTLGCIHTK